MLREEIGATFVKVLEDSGVYKTGAEGRVAFSRFIDHFISTIKQ
jgi:galactose-1-phosphate uridylyltransferase